MKHKYLLLSAFALLLFVGAGCEPTTMTNQPNEEAAMTQDETGQEETSPEKNEETCVESGGLATGPCCPGLEVVAKDQAASICAPIGTADAAPTTCTPEGGSPYVDEPCCEGLESVPDEDGIQFVCQKAIPASSTEPLTISSPKPYQEVNGTLSLEGLAPGFWFFEASSHADIVGPDGTIIATALVNAQGEWMTENDVPFSGSVTFEQPAAGEGAVIFHRHNASGMPEHDQSVSVPILFVVN